MKVVCLVGLLLVAVVSASSSSSSSPTPISGLPGQPDISFNQYSGFFHPTSTRNLFYWFVESQNDPSTDPLVLWLNGGPGCSSLGGLLSENGPFTVVDNGTKLAANPYSWNMNASVIYLESPAGVGFSYDSDPKGYINNDIKTAQESYLSLVEFFTMFPSYKGRDFYISGESYGGHYVPQLAEVILDQGSAATNAGFNLKGMAVGNPLTEFNTDSFGSVYTYFTHALISARTFEGISDHCVDWLNPSTRCADYMYDAMEEMGEIDPYDIYVDLCRRSFTAGHGRYAFHKFLSKVSPWMADPGAGHSSTTTTTTVAGGGTTYDPCIGQVVTVYLNNPDVQTALGVDGPVHWSDCSNVNYNYTNLEISTVPLYQKFLAEDKLRIWIYSGDVDTVVPYLGTQEWILGLGLNVTKAWRPWILDGQVGGYITDYEGDFKFLTIRGAGHEVPGFQPARAAAFFNAFLQGVSP